MVNQSVPPHGRGPVQPLSSPAFCGFPREQAEKARWPCRRAEHPQNQTGKTPSPGTERAVGAHARPAASAPAPSRRLRVDPCLLGLG